MTFINHEMNGSRAGLLTKVSVFDGSLSTTKHLVSGRRTLWQPPRMMIQRVREEKQWPPTTNKLSFFFQHRTKFLWHCLWAEYYTKNSLTFDWFNIFTSSYTRIRWSAKAKEIEILFRPSTWIFLVVPLFSVVVIVECTEDLISLCILSYLTHNR